MEIIKFDSLPNNKQCSMHITDDNFIIQGDFYYLVNKEFHEIKGGKDTCPIKEYIGLGIMRKRSPKQLFTFIIFAVILEFTYTIADKISQYLFFVNTEWTSYVVNAIAVLCIIQGLRLFFSKKKVIEISFLTKRFCVDEKLFNNEDINKLNQILLKLR